MKTLYNYLKFAKTALTLAAFVALCVFFWPGALAAATTFSVLGFSIAGVVGANVVFQVAAVGALTFAGIHAVGIAIDVAGALCKGVWNVLTSCCTSSRDEPTNEQRSGMKHAANHASYHHMQQQFGTTAAGYETVKPVVAPFSSGTYQPLYQDLDKQHQAEEVASIYPTVEQFSSKY